RQGLGAMWGELLMRGAGKHSSREHADAMDRLGVARSSEPGLQHLRIGASMLGTRVLEALPLLADIVLSPPMGADTISPLLAHVGAPHPERSSSASPPAGALPLRRSRPKESPPPRRRRAPPSPPPSPASPPLSRLAPAGALTAKPPAALTRQWSARARPQGS